MNYTHSIAWTFNKDKKCNLKNYNSHNFFLL